MGAKQAAPDFADLIDQLPVPIWVFDSAHRIEYNNRECSSFGSGDDTGALITQFSADVQAKLTPLIDRCLSTGKPQHFEGWVKSDIRGDGYWKVACLPLPGDKVACAVIDWTGRKTAEQALHEGEERFRALIQGTGLGLTINSSDGSFVYVNPACEQLFGVEPGGLTGRKAQEFIDPEYRERFENQHRQRYQGLTTSYELKIVDARGTERFLWVTASPRRDAQGNFDGSYALLLDISERTSAEQQLREREETAVALLNATTDAAVLIDREGAIVALNEVAAKWLGRARRELTGTRLLDCFPAELAQSRAAKIDEALAAGQPVRFQDQQAGVWFDHSLYPIVDASGEVTRLAGFSRDVTQEKRNEQLQAMLLRISEASSRSGSLPELLAEIHEELARLIDAKNFYVALYNANTDLYTFPYFVDERDADFSPQKLSRSLTDYVRRSGEPLLADEHEMNRLQESGLAQAYGPRSPIWLGAPLRTPRGVIGVVAVQDYTHERAYTRADLDLLTYVSAYVALAIERKRTEQGLRNSEVRYRMLIDGMREGLSTANAHGVFEYANPALERIYGVGEGELLGKHLDDFLEPSQGEIATRQREILLQGDTTSYEIEIKRPDGERRDLLISATPRFGSTGQVIGSSALVQDITERKRAAAEQDRLRTQILQAQKVESLGRLASGVAHDFNNILLAILGHTELACLELEPEHPVRRSLDEVTLAATRAKELVHQILVFSQQREPRREPLQLSKLVTEVLRLMRATLPPNVELRQFNRAGNDVALADPSQMHQVLMNLCSNAGQAIGDSGGIIEVTIEDVEIQAGQAGEHVQLSPGGYLKLSVSDTGHGIAAEVKQRIFEPFFTTKKIGTGTGMGLAVVESIVTRHAGAIAVESTPGQGAVFSVYLPSAAREAAGVAPQRDVAAEQPAKILFVDDERTLALVGERMLKRLGYTPVTVTSGAAALELFRQKPEEFQAVVTDLSMAPMSGDELAKAILEIRDDVPIILCTGTGVDFDDSQATVTRASGFIAKPYGLEELGAVLRDVLHRR